MSCPYHDWRANVAATEAIRRYLRLLNAGYGYNYRLWIRGPLLRLHG